jgi:group II intron reverse transcriptase/maturase
LETLGTQCIKEKVNHIIDADIEGFFEHVDHEWMMKMLGERIEDPKFLKLIRRFLKAGYMENGEWQPTVEGTPQGGIISPVLSNIYLHYVLDLWVEKRLKPNLSGYVELIRYCDDFLLLIQYKDEAVKAHGMLKDRLAKFGLTLSEEKTRRIEFGRFSKEDAERRGEKPATFNFVGFTHYVDKQQNGKFKVGRKSRVDKLCKSLKEFGVWLKAVRNQMGIKELWKKIAQKLRGHFEFYGVSGNARSLKNYYRAAISLVYKWVNRRSQRKSMNWNEFDEYLKRFPLPIPKIHHSFYKAEV